MVLLLGQIANLKGRYLAMLIFQKRLEVRIWTQASATLQRPGLSFSSADAGCRGSGQDSSGAFRPTHYWLPLFPGLPVALETSALTFRLAPI